MKYITLVAIGLTVCALAYVGAAVLAFQHALAAHLSGAS